MKIGRLWVDSYKNLRNCEIKFAQVPVHAIIGGNGSGKSNLLEAILHILIGVYFKKPPPFNFVFEYEAQRRQVTIKCEKGKLSVYVDGEAVRLDYFAERLRDGPAQVFYPEMTFVYYSGECQRVRDLIKRYRKDFQRLTQKPETDKFRPLFVESSNEQSQVILLALFAHKDRIFLKRLGIEEAVDVSIVLRSPKNFNPEEHEPKLWGTLGAVRKVIAALDDTSQIQESIRQDKIHTEEEFGKSDYSERRIYYFNDNARSGKSISDLANRLAKGGDNLYLALEQLKDRGILHSVNFQLRGQGMKDLFEYDQLSEGEKQLIAVIGAIRLTNRHENLVLLDEPDTHLNAHWVWDYASMLSDAFGREQKPQSTVLMATHDPVMISGLSREQVWLAHSSADDTPMFTNPMRHPRGQGIANLLCSSEFFGLPSSLDRETQKLLDERLQISIKDELTEPDKARLKALNQQLEIITPGVSERDPDYVDFLRQRYQQNRR